MGRTISYTLTKSKGKFNRKELEAIYNVSKKYNAGNYSKIWTCENFFLNPYDFYPNWNGKYKHVSPEKAWKEINSQISEHITKDVHYFDVILKLFAEKQIVLHNGLPKRSLHGFVKVQGNELNSLLVFTALLEVSQLIPAVEIEIHDEGEFLLCDVKIRNGKTFPLINNLIKEIQRYTHLMLFSENFSGNILSKFNYKPEDFMYETRMNLDIANGYGNMIQYINEKLRNMKEIENALKAEGLDGNELYLFNLENRGVENWFPAFVFTREVEIEKYVGYRCSPATLLDGFSGESFHGLTTEDSESKSYRSIALLQKLLNLPEAELRILGEDI
jgi:hypothetical protein